MSKKLRVLVVDDDRSMTKTLADILEIKGYDTATAHSGSEALEKVADGIFDCVLSDIKMPGINGVELYRAIKTKQPDIPVVLMTAYSSNSLVKEGLEEGVISVLTKPLDLTLLLRFFSSLRKERSVVIVDDDPQFCKTLGDILGKRGFIVNQISDPNKAIEQLGADEGVVLLDMKLNHIGGLEVLRQIREQHPHLPVILVTGYRAEMTSAIEVALTLGAYTCLYKPLEIEQLLDLLTQVHHQELSRILGQPVKKTKGGKL